LGKKRNSTSGFAEVAKTTKDLAVEVTYDDYL
jgi:hypothetical protein